MTGERRGSPGFYQVDGFIVLRRGHRLPVVAPCRRRPGTVACEWQCLWTRRHTEPAETVAGRRSGHPRHPPAGPQPPAAVAAICHPLLRRHRPSIGLPGQQIAASSRLTSAVASMNSRWPWRLQVGQQDLIPHRCRCPQAEEGPGWTTRGAHRIGRPAAMNAMRLSWGESVFGGADAPAQRIEQDQGYQGDHRDRDRRGEAENHDRKLEQGRADGADHYRGGSAEQSPLSISHPLVRFPR